MFILTTRLLHTLQKALNCALDENKRLRKRNVTDKKEYLEEFVMVINEIQDIDAMRDKTEEEKKELRDNIINVKRYFYVNKIEELS